MVTPTQEPPRRPLAGWALVSFSLAVVAMPISLAGSQALLALATILYAAHLLRHPMVPRFPPVKLPLALYCATTVVSIFYAENPTVGWVDVRKFVLFLILLLAVNLILVRHHLRWICGGLFLAGSLAGLVAVGQFSRQYWHVQAVDPSHLYTDLTSVRITGFMGHWMNFGGQQMLIFTVLTSFLLLGTRAGAEPTSRFRRLWWIALGVIALSIVLNFTRGVWLGCAVACVYLVARCRSRWLWALPVAVAALYLLAPGLVRQRLNSLRHPAADPSLAIRFEIWNAGLNMIKRHPWVGVGPNNINEVYVLYLPRGHQPEIGYHEHMHDDFLQFAAERGLPCLAAWLWFMGALLWHFFRIRRDLAHRRQPTWVVDAAIAGWLAFVAEGVFEFNFGTSPVLMVFLFVMALPFVAEVASLIRSARAGVHEAGPT